jgi:hypothetical protein
MLVRGWSSGESRFKCSKRGRSLIKIARLVFGEWGRSGGRKRRLVEGDDRPFTEHRRGHTQVCLSIGFQLC